MRRLEVPLVNDSGRTIGYGDRWLTHRVRNGPDGPVLGQKHVGITIACIDDEGRILVQHRRHKIFDKVWSFSGDTHPYRMYGSLAMETIFHAARRCAMDDLGAVIKGWKKTLSVSYSARDPRNPRYCENELLHLLVVKHCCPFHMNTKNAYELMWVELKEVSRDTAADLKKEPIERTYAPWVHTIFALNPERIREALSPATSRRDGR
jgi:isopentenyldiphosphate isomerase